MFPLPSSIIFQWKTTTSLWVSNSFHEYTKNSKSFCLAKVTKKWESGCLACWQCPWTSWAGGKVQCRSSDTTSSHLPSAFWGWCPELEASCSVRAECAVVVDISQSCFVPGDWWLLSVRRHYISKYWDSDMFWGELCEYFSFVLWLNFWLTRWHCEICTILESELFLKKKKMIIWKVSSP